MNVWVLPGWLLGGGPDDGGAVRRGAGEGLGVASVVVAEGVGLEVGLAVGSAVTVGAGIGVSIGGRVGAAVGAGVGVAGAPNGDRPVPTIHTAMSSANVTANAAMSSANCFTGLFRELDERRPAGEARGVEREARRGAVLN